MARAGDLPVARFAAISESAVREVLGLLTALLPAVETSDLDGETSGRPLDAPVPCAASRLGLGSRLGALEDPGVKWPPVRGVGGWPPWKARSAPWSAEVELGVLIASVGPVAQAQVRLLSTQEKDTSWSVEVTAELRIMRWLSGAKEMSRLPR